MPKSKEELELDNDLVEELDWIQLPEDLEGSSNKRSLNKIKEILAGTFATIAYRIITKKVCNGSKIDASNDST